MKKKLSKEMLRPFFDPRIFKLFYEIIKLDFVFSYLKSPNFKRS
jgi:hypothetical protein